MTCVLKDILQHFYEKTQLYHLCCIISLHASNSFMILPLSILLSFAHSVHHYHSLTFTLSLSISFSLLPLPPPPSVTHSDSLCNMPSSKLNSTLLDLQPFLSSKWLSSVITLQPEWETQRRGREEGWQTETWHERRGNAGLIIHTYCSKKRVSEGKRDTGRKREREK